MSTLDIALAYRFASYTVAAAIARNNAVDDDDWTYTVHKAGAAYVISVYDEQGAILGYL